MTVGILRSAGGALLLIPTLIVAAAVFSQAQTTSPPRDTAPAAAAAASGITVRGRVTAAATGQPLHRVRVTLNGGSQTAPAGVTDLRGEFEITDVAPGTYTASLARAGYLTVLYGQKRPREAGRPIVIRAGEPVEALDVAMQRGGVLAGRVLDDAGDPFPGVRVEALEMRYLRGRRVPVAARIVATNDAGEYRLNGLDPGAYLVRASSRDVWEADDAKNTFVFASTYFPGVTSGDQAQSLTLRAGQELAGLDLRMIAGREARITGVVQDATGGAVAGLVVNLSDLSRTTGGALLSSGSAGDTRTNERGEFRFDKLFPGEYMVYAGGPNDTTNVSMVLNAGESRHVTLTPARPPVVAGTVVADDGGPLPFAASRVRVEPIDANPDIVLPLWAAPNAQSPRPDWTFRIVNMVGGYLFRLSGLPDEWRLKAVMRGGRDITDTPTAFARGAADVEGVQIVLTRQVARVEGTVSADATVVLFAENRAQWGIGSRFIRTARPDGHGRFAIGGLAPGVYRIAARDFIPDGQWEDADFLQSLMREAMRVELKADATETVKLTVGEGR
jgi:protocatechuate 3,4-dioxygenase beta subunit